MRGEAAQNELRRTLALYAKARATEAKANDAFDRLTEDLFSELSGREWQRFHDHNKRLFDRMVKAKTRTRNAFEIATMIHALKILGSRS
jgi:hypothetical protein